MQFQCRLVRSLLVTFERREAGELNKTISTLISSACHGSELKAKCGATPFIEKFWQQMGNVQAIGLVKRLAKKALGALNKTSLASI